MRGGFIGMEFLGDVCCGSDFFFFGEDFAQHFIGSGGFVFELTISARGIFYYNVFFWVVATQIFLEFSPFFGEDEPILTNIFQRGGSTTNQFFSLVSTIPSFFNKWTFFLIRHLKRRSLQPWLKFWRSRLAGSKQDHFWRTRYLMPDDEQWKKPWLFRVYRG